MTDTAPGRADATPPALDPDALDAIAQNMTLARPAPPDLLERVDRWYQDLLDGVWRWLKRQSGGEEGPLGALETRLERWLQDGLGLGGGEAVGAALRWGSVAILLGALAWLAWRIWREHRPLPSRARAASIDLLGRDPDLMRPLDELPRIQWVPATFTQLCVELAVGGRLPIAPHLTNQTLAARAVLPPEHARELAHLAHAADRVQFAGWQPDEGELQRLLATAARVRAGLTAVPSPPGTAPAVPAAAGQAMPPPAAP